MAIRRLKISKEYFHGNAKLVVEHYAPHISGIREALNGEVGVTVNRRSTRGVERAGITASSLNIALRRSFRRVYGQTISLETHVDEGILHSGKGIRGFDFSIYDKKNNLIALRNRCFGKLRLVDGQRKWNSFLTEHRDLAHLAAAADLGPSPDGEDVPRLPPESPIILGEFQFANWALLYRDFFKALDAQRDPGLDLFVYVSATGSLKNAVSKSTVNFDDAVKGAQLFKQVLRMPIWFIGIDFAS